MFIELNNDVKVEGIWKLLLNRALQNYTSDTVPLSLIVIQSTIEDLAVVKEPRPSKYC